MKLIKFLCGCILVVVGSSCTQDIIDIDTPNNTNAYIDGNSVVLTLGIQAPDMPDAGSRAFTDTPDYNDLNLYIVEFVDNDSPLRNTLTTVYRPDEETLEGNIINYKVTLNKSNEGRVLHLIAVPKSVELNIEYGLEASVIPNLVLTDQTPAYWRRLAFPDGYVVPATEGSNETLTPEMSNLNSVALVRNYSRITMTSTVPAADFQFKGFAIVNNPTQGTVAPWNAAANSFPEFLNSDQTPKAYTDLSSYKGILPNNTSFSNQEAGPVVNDGDVSAKYLYERPFNSIRHTFIIVRGRYKTDTYDTYYKLDLGKNDADAVFRYYNLLRNFSYNITLTGVGTRGYRTALQAAQGVVYNNFSFDISLEDMLNMSDGKNIVYVNFTTAVLTDPNEQVLEFKYRYRGLSASSGPTYNNGNVKFVDLNEGGPVIKNVSYGNTDDADGWRTVTLTCYGATTETKTQSFMIVNPDGLGRTINLILHEKWDFMNLCVYPGEGQNYNTAYPAYLGSIETDYPGWASCEAQEPLIVFFDLPDDLPEAMFPLDFVLESDVQNIENNPIGNLVVTSGTSSFPDVIGARIKYIKSVTWTQYNDPLEPDLTDGDNGLVLQNPNGTTTRRVRCRFRTITSLENLGLQSSLTTIRITNSNYSDGDVEFKREIPDPWK